MAYTTRNYINPRTGQRRPVPLGFSWTVLFFGCFVPLLRGDWKWALIMFLAAWLTFGLAWLVFPFVYNGSYRRALERDGFFDSFPTTTGMMR